MGTYQGRQARLADPWSEVYRLAFASLADLTGPTTDAGTMVLGAVTWTLRNTSNAYVDSCNIASGKLVWNLNATSSLTNTQTAATGPLLRTLVNNVSSLLTSSVEPRIPLRFAAAVTDVGDENTEVIGIGCMGTAGGSGNGFVIETGFVSGAAKTQWHSYSTSKSTNPSPISRSSTALMLQVQGAHCVPYYGDAVSAEPPSLTSDADWTPGTPMTTTAYQGAVGADFLFASTANGQLALLAANGNTDNDFAPAHTGIACAVPRSRLRIT